MFFSVTFLAGCDGGGIGQSFDSPNGKYAASAMPFYGKSARIEYRVKETRTGRTIWKHDEARDDESAPPYGAGFGELELIQWSQDSLEVRFATKCRERLQVVEWIATHQDKQGLFSKGAKCDSGLRPVHRDQQNGQE